MPTSYWHLSIANIYQPSFIFIFLYLTRTTIKILRYFFWATKFSVKDWFFTPFFLSYYRKYFIDLLVCQLYIANYTILFSKPVSVVVMLVIIHLIFSFYIFQDYRIIILFHFMYLQIYDNNHNYIILFYVYIVNKWFLFTLIGALPVIVQFYLI